MLEGKAQHGCEAMPGRATGKRREGCELRMVDLEGHCQRDVPIVHLRREEFTFERHIGVRTLTEQRGSKGAKDCCGSKAG